MGSEPAREATSSDPSTTIPPLGPLCLDPSARIPQARVTGPSARIPLLGSICSDHSIRFPPFGSLQLDPSARILPLTTHKDIYAHILPLILSGLSALILPLGFLQSDPSVRIPPIRPLCLDPSTHKDIFAHILPLILSGLSARILPLGSLLLESSARNRIPSIGSLHSDPSTWIFPLRSKIPPLGSLHSDPFARILPLGTSTRILPLISILSDLSARIPLFCFLRLDPFARKPSFEYLHSDQGCRNDFLDGGAKIIALLKKGSVHI